MPIIRASMDIPPQPMTANSGLLLITDNPADIIAPKRMIAKKRESKLSKELSAICCSNGLFANTSFAKRAIRIKNS